MTENNIIFLADAFGYGPITTLLLIAEQLRKKKMQNLYLLDLNYV